MSDLISKRVIQDALIEKISRLNAEGEKSINVAREFIRFKRYIDGITPIIVPSIVRCKDCKHRRENCGMGDHRWCDFHRMTTRADDFCSYGRRKK